MQKFLFILLAIFIFGYSSSFSQRYPGGINPNVVNDNQDTLKNQNYMYFSPDVKLAEMLNREAIELGISGGFTFNNTFIIGGGYYYLFTQNLNMNNTSFSVPPHLRLEYGGIELGYNLQISGLFGLSWQSLFGIGQINISQSVNADVSSDQNGYWLFCSNPVSIFTCICPES